MRKTDVLIVGAGPAGTMAAINLAPLRRVTLVERRVEITPRIGESLVPAARRLLADMELLESFLTEGHEPWYGKRAVWGGPDPQEIDFLRDPDGHGWHLDRARFEQWLRNTAKARGADLLCPATVDKLEHDGQRWQVLLKTGGDSLAIAADLLIDAGGRAAPIARRLGMRAEARDRLVCAWVCGRDECDRSRGLTYVEAVEEGWWYTAPLPRQQRVLSFHTDGDLPSARIVRERGGLLSRARGVTNLLALLADVAFLPNSGGGTTRANSAMLESVAGENWLAVGDAAISFDPISSQGLLNALFTGLAAAEAANRHLNGDTRSLPGYPRIVRDIQDAYQRHLALYYAAETRWSEAPFWQRRHMLAKR